MVPETFAFLAAEPVHENPEVSLTDQYPFQIVEQLM